MLTKSNRIKTLIQIIENKRIGSQEELLSKLRDKGFDCTQATLSRDLKRLKAGKISDGRESSYYVLPGQKKPEVPEVRSAAGFISIEFSGNMGVIKTVTAYSHTLALTIDAAGIYEIIGTIAGDDTVFLVLREGVTHQEALNALVEKIPELKEKLYKI